MHRCTDAQMHRPPDAYLGTPTDRHALTHAHVHMRRCTPGHTRTWTDMHTGGCSHAHTHTRAHMQMPSMHTTWHADMETCRCTDPQRCTEAQRHWRIDTQMHSSTDAPALISTAIQKHIFLPPCATMEFFCTKPKFLNFFKTWRIINNPCWLEFAKSKMVTN